MKICHPCISALIMSAVIGIAACSTPDNSVPPAELTTIDNAEYVRELWSTDTGKASNQSFFKQQPWIRGNKIYTIDASGLVQQVDATKGRTDWTFATGLLSITGLAGNEEGLIATSREGEVSWFDFDEPLKPVWKQQLKSEIRNRAAIKDSQIFLRTVDGRLSVLDAKNGEVMWSVSRRVPALSLTGNSYPIVTDDLVISGFDNGKLVAFARENGSVVWETTVSSPRGRSEIERLIDLDGQFVLRDGVIYISSFQGNLAAVTVNSGQIVWTRKFSSYQAIGIDEEALYLTDDKSHLWSIDRRTGSAFWKQEVLNARKITAPLLMENKLLVGDLQGYIHYFDKRDGKLLARKQTNDQPYLTQPVAIGTTAIVLDRSGQLTALTQQR